MGIFIIIVRLSWWNFCKRFFIRIIPVEDYKICWLKLILTLKFRYVFHFIFTSWVRFELELWQIIWGNFKLLSLEIWPPWFIKSLLALTCIKHWFIKSDVFSIRRRELIRFLSELRFDVLNFPKVQKIDCFFALVEIFLNVHSLVALKWGIYGCGDWCCMRNNSFWSCFLHIIVRCKNQRFWKYKIFRSFNNLRLYIVLSCKLIFSLNWWIIPPVWWNSWRVFL